jgi:hypothetical protein
VKERLFLDRVYVLADDTIIDQRIEYAINVLSYLAGTKVAERNTAVVRAEIAAHHII